MNTLKLFCLFAFLLLLQGAVMAQASGYHVANKITLGGDGGWDYLAIDSEARRLYVSHATKVIVVDIETDKAVGEIPNTNGVHGIAIAHDLGRGFTSNGRDATVTIFDLKTLAVIGSAKSGGNPDAIVYDPASRHVFTFNRVRDAAEASSTVIDAATGNVIETIKLGGRPEFAVSDGKGEIFVNLDDKSEIAVIDTKKNVITARWTLAPGKSPSGLAIDLKKRRLYSVCENEKMIVLDANNGKLLAELPIGKGTDAAAFDPGTGLAFSSNGGDGTLTVVSEGSGNKLAVLDNVRTQSGARTMAVDQKTHKVYLSTATFGPAPAPTADRPNPRPVAIPGSFMVLVLAK
jgi:DNA-binding beta-propeller fold protein YncE